MARMKFRRPALRLPIRLTAAALAAAALATSTAHAGPEHRHDLAAMLAMERAEENIFKAFFPDRATGTRAAITLHGHLLESHWDAGYLVLQLDEGELARLARFGFRFERADAFIAQRNQRLLRLQMQAAARGPSFVEPRSIPGYSCYETVEETFAAGDALVAARPDLASWIDAGDSWLKTQGTGGYDIRVLKLTNAAVAGIDNGVAGRKPRLFINSAIHAREYTTAPLVLEFARQLVGGHGLDADATWILDHHEVHLMLHANPDGRKRAETGLSWRKNVNNSFCANTNTRGVDLNRNFAFSWNTTNGTGSSGSACSLTYRGPSAGSEPEVRAVENYVRGLWPDRRGPAKTDAAPADTSGIHLDIHSFSELVLWPWGDTSTPAPNGTALQTLGRKFAFWNGYQPTQSIGLYPTDGTSDGPSYGELGVAAFTFELGTSFFQSCGTYESTIKPRNLPALFYAAKVVRTPYLTPAGPDVTSLVLAGTASTTGVVIGTPVALAATAVEGRYQNSFGVEPSQQVAGGTAWIDVPPWLPGAAPIALNAADGSFDSASEALVATLNTAGLAPGRHIVYVRGRDSTGAEGAISAVWLNLLAPPPIVFNEIEPNSVVSIANAIPSLPATVNGSMGDRRADRPDSDTFRVTVPPLGRLAARLTPNPRSNYDLLLLDAGGQLIASSRNGSGLEDSLVFVNPGPAPVVVHAQVIFVSGAQGRAEGDYVLQLDP